MYVQKMKREKERTEARSVVGGDGQRLVQIEFVRLISVVDRMGFVVLDEFVQSLERAFANHVPAAVGGEFDAEVSDGVEIVANTERIVSHLGCSALNERDKCNGRHSLVVHCRG